MNTYIQDKLDAFRTKVKDIIENPLLEYNTTEGHENPRKCTKEDIDIIVNLHEQSLTDYHNHIVEILEKERQTWAKESIGEVAVKSIINRLQDTNPKE